MWNLDFFRTFLPPICLNINTLQVLALDYVIAVYPLCLVVLAYALIQLHARGCLPLVILWMPFRKCHIRFRRKIDDAKASIIDVFASFLTLSHVKFLSVSFDLLVPTLAYNTKGEKVGLYLYYDADFKYFGTEHLPYGILALFVSFFFLILPLLLLLLYPLKIFQKLCGNWQALRIFIDSFQGSYKDGVVEGKYDCRYFSVTFLIMRIALFLTYAFTLNGYFYGISTILLLILALVLLTTKPYRRQHSVYNTVDVGFVLILASWYTSVLCIMTAGIKSPQSIHFSIAVCALIGFVPLIYIPFLLLAKIWHNQIFRRKLTQVLPFFRRTLGRSTEVPYEQSLNDTLSQRDMHSEEEWMLSHNYNRKENYNSLS